MTAVRKILVGYLLTTGIAAHLLVIGVWLARPDLVWRAQDYGIATLQQLLPTSGLMSSTAGGVTSASEALQAAFPAWQADLTGALPPGQIRISGQPVKNLQAAMQTLRDGDILQLGPGVYRQALVLARNHVTIQGLGHVVFEGATAEGKAAIVVRGNDTRIANIECRGMRVPDRNGACIRLEGADLVVDGVYFHSGEQGILTGKHPGQVTIRNSRFEMLGKEGRAHGIYTGGGHLRIVDSLFLSSVDQGHEIKSRSESTIIERTVVASLSGNDSRLIDLPHGGILEIRDSILAEGPASVNSDLIGFGLEGRLHEQHRISLHGNIILLDNAAPTRLLHQADGTPPVNFEQNLVVGDDDAQQPGINLWVASRKEAKLPDYPALPPLPQN